MIDKVMEKRRSRKNWQILCGGEVIVEVRLLWREVIAKKRTQYSSCRDGLLERWTYKTT